MTTEATDKALLHQRAEALERQREEIRQELDEVLRELANLGSDEDDFAMRFAQRMMDERDEARRRIAELESKLTEKQTEAEIRAQAAEARLATLLVDAGTMRTAISSIINDPLLERSQVQARLLVVHERVRDRNYSTG